MARPTVAEFSPSTCRGVRIRVGGLRWIRRTHCQSTCDLGRTYHVWNCQGVSDDLGECLNGHYSFSPLNFILSNPYNILGMCWGILYTSSVPYHHPYNINVILRYIKLMEACLCQILMLNCWVSPGVGVFRAAQVSMVGQTSGPEEFEPNLNGEFMGSSAPIAANLHHKSWRSSGDWWNYFWIVLGVLVYQTYDCVQKTRNKCLLSSQEVGLFHIHVGNLQATWQSLQLYLACAELTFFL